MCYSLPTTKFAHESCDSNFIAGPSYYLVQGVIMELTEVYYGCELVLTRGQHQNQITAGSSLTSGFCE